MFLACNLMLWCSVLAVRGVRWWLLGSVLGAGMFGATWFGGGETVVTTAAVLRRIRPWPRTQRIEIHDVVSADTVIADYQVNMFGGWEGSRGGLHGALVESLEGPRHVGNRAVRLELRSGAVVQFATWKPIAVLEALRSAQERRQP